MRRTILKPGMHRGRRRDDVTGILRTSLSSSRPRHTRSSIVIDACAMLLPAIITWWLRLIALDTTGSTSLAVLYKSQPLPAILEHSGFTYHPVVTRSFLRGVMPSLSGAIFKSDSCLSSLYRLWQLAGEKSGWKSSARGFRKPDELGKHWKITASYHTLWAITINEGTKIAKDAAAFTTPHSKMVCITRKDGQESITGDRITCSVATTLYLRLLQKLSNYSSQVLFLSFDLWTIKDINANAKQEIGSSPNYQKGNLLYWLRTVPSSHLGEGPRN